MNPDNPYTGYMIGEFDYEELKRRHALRKLLFVSGKLNTSEDLPHRGFAALQSG